MTFLSALLWSLCLTLSAQPSMSKVQLLLVPDHADALYRVGETVKMKVTALDCGMALNDVTLTYEVSEDLMTPHLTKTLQLKGNEGQINVGTLKKPGFLRVKAILDKDGKRYTSLATVGFDTEKLLPTVTRPDDFEAFWQGNLEAARRTPLRPTMTLLPEKCTDKVKVYHISYRNIGGTKMYGMLTMPAAEGRYPAVLRFPGAGVSEKTGDIAHAEQGVIVLELGIHGIPVNLAGSVYSDLNGTMGGYPLYNLDNRDTYYYKRVYVGCVRAIDFLETLPQYNGKVGTLGGSQGGALSVATSALDERICASVVYFPALCDLEGYTHQRAGGWPPVFKDPKQCTPEKLNTVRYYDTANFARDLRRPVYFAFGYNDIVCAPTTTHSTYNVITAPKQLIISANSGHWLFPEQATALWDWLIKTLQEE